MQLVLLVLTIFDAHSPLSSGRSLVFLPVDYDQLPHERVRRVHKPRTREAKRGEVGDGLGGLVFVPSVSGRACQKV
jgi:hypothetical protein